MLAAIYIYKDVYTIHNNIYILHLELKHFFFHRLTVQATLVVYAKCTQIIDFSQLKGPNCSNKQEREHDDLFFPAEKLVTD